MDETEVDDIDRELGVVAIAECGEDFRFSEHALVGALDEVGGEGFERVGSGAEGCELRSLLLRCVGSKVNERACSRRYSLESGQFSQRCPGPPGFRINTPPY